MDNIRIATEKKALQKGLKQNNVSAAKKKPASSKYTFDMINTDDETDDESRSKLGRPTPPEWSLRKFIAAGVFLFIIIFVNA